MQLYEQLYETREKTTPLSETLASYGDLPPDMHLARVKVEEARGKMRSLEEKLVESMGGDWQ